MSNVIIGWLGEDRLPETEGLRNKKKELLSIRQDNPERTAELTPKGPIGPHEPELWRAVAYIAKKRHGKISLWEWKGTKSDPNSKGRWVILKTENDEGHGPIHDQTQEGEIMDQLMKENRTDHLVTMVYRGSDYHKLYLEYCMHGDLKTNLEERQRHRQYYTEEQLWTIFLCLIKASRSLGGEHLGTATDGPASVIAHFDLKPENVYLGDSEHSVNPDLEYHTCRGGQSILKIGDFGDAWPLKSLPNPRPINDTSLAKQAIEIGARGTTGYHPPEQRILMEKNPKFSPDWNDWHDWEANFNYSAKTNIWGIGVIMWQLMCLTDESPLIQGGTTNNNKFQYTINREENNVIPKIEVLNRETYGPEITAKAVKNRYSWQNSLLIDLVLWCLMEYPVDRPSNDELLKIIQKVRNPDYNDGKVSFSDEKKEIEPELEPEPEPERKPLPNTIQSEILSPHMDRSKRSWTAIPNIFLKRNPYYSANATPPTSPVTRLPGGLIPNRQPDTPSTPGRRPKTPAQTAGTKRFERIYSTSTADNTPAGSTTFSPFRRNPGSPRFRPLRRSKTYWSCFCMPCCYWDFSNALWILVFALSIWATGFCLFYSMLVEYEAHL